LKWTYSRMEFWIESIKSIEVLESGGQPAPSGCIVNCPHCGKPIRISLGKESFADLQPQLERKMQ
jgi:hypothetical protein